MLYLSLRLVCTIIIIGAVYCWCAYAESSFHIKTEDDSNVTSEHPLDASKWKCMECGKCYDSSRRLADHVRIHSVHKPFECTVCSKQFRTSHELALHSRIHSGEKPYKCHLCEKVFSQSGTLQIHMRVHTGDKPYKCQLCNKSFAHSNNMQRHKRKVHGKPYDCPYCGMLFKTNMEQHIRTHTGEKPYSCRHCAECFTFLSQLNVHLMKSHNEDAWLD